MRKRCNSQSINRSGLLGSSRLARFTDPLKSECETVLETSSPSELTHDLRPASRASKDTLFVVPAAQLLPEAGTARLRSGAEAPPSSSAGRRHGGCRSAGVAC